MKKFFLLSTFLLMMSCATIPAGNTVYRPNSGYPQNSSTINNERQEFENLMDKDLINKKRVNAEVLTYLLNDDDPKDKKTAAVIENLSNCNIILRLVGINNNLIYNLPIKRNSKNQFVISKGNFTLKSNVCGANYYSQKNIKAPLILKLSAN